MDSVNNRLRRSAWGWVCQLHASCFPSWPEWIFGGPLAFLSPSCGAAEAMQTDGSGEGGSRGCPAPSRGSVHPCEGGDALPLRMRCGAPTLPAGRDGA